MVAISDRLSLAVGHVASALRLGEHLPDRYLPAKNRREKFPFLLFAAPLQDDRRDNARDRVEDMVKAETVLGKLGLKHRLVMDREPRAPVLRGEHRKQPAFSSQPAGQMAPEPVLLLVRSEDHTS